MPLGCIVRCRMSEKRSRKHRWSGSDIFIFPFIEYLCDVVDRTPEVGCRPRTYPIRKRMRPARFVFTIIYLLGVVLSPALVRAQGLRFRDSEAPIDQRTSYTVFSRRPPTYSGRFDLDSTFRSIPRRRSAISSVSRTTPITESTISSTTGRGRRSSSGSTMRGAAA